MNHYVFSILLIILIVICDMLALYFIKKAQKSDCAKYLTIVAILYLGIIACLYLLNHDILPEHHMGIVRYMVSLCVAILFGNLIYLYKLNTYSYIAIMFATLAIIFSYISISLR